MKVLFTSFLLLLDAGLPPTAVLAGLVCASVGQAALITVSGTGGFVFDDNAGGANFDAVTVDPRIVTNVTLTLSGFNHTWIGDLIIRLEHVGVAGPVIVLSRLGNASNPIGGCSATVGCGANLAGLSLGDYTFATSGTAFSTIPGIATTTTNIPSGTYTALTSLAPLTGAPAAGTWRLRISDNQAANVANSTWTWSANLTVPDAAIPEPGSVALSAIGLILLAAFRRWKR